MWPVPGGFFLFLPHLMFLSHLLFLPLSTPSFYCKIPQHPRTIGEHLIGYEIITKLALNDDSIKRYYVNKNYSVYRFLPIEYKLKQGKSSTQEPIIPMTLRDGLSAL